MKQSGSDFGALLARFWLDFGAKLGGKLDPSWCQTLTQGGPKTMSKRYLKQGAGTNTRRIMEKGPRGQGT